MRSPSILVFSLALNGYQWCYAEYLSTHSDYAKRNGYDYCAIKKPIATALGVECCWLKLTLMLRAFEKGYSMVMFVDSDAKVKKTTPSLCQLESDSSLFFMAKGYSKRFNSGVLIGKNHPSVIQWINRILESRNQQVITANDVGWGENGHIIQAAQDVEFIHTLDTKWNNTFDPYLDDFIRHFSHGPLRKKQVVRGFHKFLSRFSSIYARYTKIFFNQRNTDDKLQLLTQKVVDIYPEFNSKH